MWPSLGLTATPATSPRCMSAGGLRASVPSKGISGGAWAKTRFGARAGARANAAAIRKRFTSHPPILILGEGGRSWGCREVLVRGRLRVLGRGQVEIGVDDPFVPGCRPDPGVQLLGGGCVGRALRLQALLQARRAAGIEGQGRLGLDPDGGVVVGQ